MANQISNKEQIHSVVVACTPRKIGAASTSVGALLSVKLGCRNEISVPSPGVLEGGGGVIRGQVFPGSSQAGFRKLNRIEALFIPLCLPCNQHRHQAEGAAVPLQALHLRIPTPLIATCPLMIGSMRSIPANQAPRSHPKRPTDRAVSSTCRRFCLHKKNLMMFC